MIIAVASGKGGTGKTTIATSLALSLAAGARTGADHTPLFVDCDAEAPNAHLFLKPHFQQREDVGILVPQVDAGACTRCGKCADVCPYHAIAVLGESVLVFPQLCHGCGSCALICPSNAITEIPDVMGVIESGDAAAGISFWRGVMNIGEPMATPIIRHLKRRALQMASQDRIVILDAPPGASCPVVETLRGSDFVLLVTEPTPFGLHDLRLAWQVCQELSIPAGVIVNRDGLGDSRVEQFCEAEGLPILMRIPFERAIAEGVAQGQTLVEIRPAYAPQFRQLFEQIASAREVAT